MGMNKVFNKALNKAIKKYKDKYVNTLDTKERFIKENRSILKRVV